jgi:hypothetical protein
LRWVTPCCGAIEIPTSDLSIRDFERLANVLGVEVVELVA